MKRPLALLAGLLASSPALAAPEKVDARDWPYEFVRTSATLYLKGSPREMTGLVGQGSVRLTYRFYPNGMVKLYETDPGGFEETRFKRGRLVEVRTSNSHDKGGYSTYFTPHFQDDRQRVTALQGVNHADDGVQINLGSGDMAMLVTYGDGYQIKESYFRLGGVVTNVMRERYEFAPEGWLAVKCPLPAKQKQCSADPGPGWNFGRTTYGPFGPLRHENRHIVITYTYENGELATETRTEQGETPRQYTVRYGAYRHDACGNWIERRVEAPPPEGPPEPWTETRTFTYYEACPVAP